MKLGINGRFYGARPTGVQRFARDLSARLYEHQEVTLFLPASLPRPAEVPAHVPVEYGRLGGHAWEQLELPWRTRAGGTDVVLHLSGTGSIWGGRNVVVVYDVTPLSHPEWFTRSFRIWFRLALGLSAQRACRVVTISQWSSGEVERVLAIPRSRIRVVRQGIEPISAPAPAAEVERVRTRWKLPDTFLLALGGRNPRKNIAFMVRILSSWRERYGTAPCLVLIGEEYSHLHARSALHIGNGLDVRVIGHVSDADLHALYTAASAFCFPSLAEGFGRPPLEAMACGTPAVVADYGAAAEVLEGGALILPLQVDAWVDHLASLLASESERQHWALAGREQSSRYEWAGAVDDLIETCRAVALESAEGR